MNINEVSIPVVEVTYQSHICMFFPAGVVLAVVSHGGLLLATNQITPGSLMSFLVATQTIQRSAAQVSVRLCVCVYSMYYHNMCT